MEFKYIYLIIGIVLIIFSDIFYIVFSISKRNKDRDKYIEKWKKEAQDKFEKEYRTKQEALAAIIEEKQKYITTLENNAHNELERLKTQKTFIEREISEKQSFNSSLLKIREDELNRLMAEKKARAFSDLRHEVDDWAQSAQEAAEFQRDQILKEYQEDIDNTYEELRKLYLEVNEYKDKRNALNEEILRARALEEQQDFYSIQIPESSKHDLALLNEIRHDFSKIDILDKLIYDNYIKKPVDEMIKRVLPEESPSGIYKITRLKTKEVYIGRSTDVKSRWQQHCKSCYHCGTISHSRLHDVMENDGIWNFTFELLEEVPKDKLNEREKYWIKFYDSQKYGLNERVG